MSLKAELETWVEALKAYDAEEFDKALELFGRIADSSKILCNIGLIYATLGEHELAVENFNNATRLDSFLAVAYFQCGVSNFLMGRYEYAYKDFEEAYLYLRQNQDIKYEQLGLKFTLYSSEVLFNRGLTQIYMSRRDEGMSDLRLASQEKVTPEHDVIEDCIRDAGEGYTVFSIPVGVLYRPPENKVKNTKAKDYLGKAKLVAATDSRDLGTGFSGPSLRDAVPAVAAPPPSRALEEPPKTAPPTTRTRPEVDFPAPALRPSPSMQNPAPNATSPRINVAGPRLERAPTQIQISAPSANAAPGQAPRGGLSRNVSLGNGPRREPSARSAPPKLPSAARLTEIYDDYMGATDEAPPLPPDASMRVANWAQKVGPSPSVRSTMNRQPSRRRLAAGGSGRRSQRAISTYEEEEEGYGSGDYEDGGFEMVKIKIKLHYREDTRGMALAPETAYDDFLERLTAKFGRPLNGLALRFRDEDGAMISLKDESDYDLAVETARESARGRPEGKLEVWCDDV